MTLSSSAEMHIPLEQSSSHKTLKSVLPVWKERPRPPVLALLVHPEAQIAEGAIALRVFCVLWLYIEWREKGKEERGRIEGGKEGGRVEDRVEEDGGKWGKRAEGEKKGVK